MIAAVGSRGIGGARGHRRAARDLYATDVPTAHGLARVERFPGGVWECACGHGDLARVLQAFGTDVVSTDIEHRGFGRGGVDFLRTKKLRRPNIVTNPPFSLWRQFAEHALSLEPRKAVMLGRLQQLEDWDGRADFFRRTRCSRAIVTGRSKMRPDGAPDMGHLGMIPFAWYVWDADDPGDGVHVRVRWPQ